MDMEFTLLAVFDTPMSSENTAKAEAMHGLLKGAGIAPEEYQRVDDVLTALEKAYELPEIATAPHPVAAVLADCIPNYKELQDLLAKKPPMLGVQLIFRHKPQLKLRNLCSPTVAIVFF